MRRLLLALAVIGAPLAAEAQSRLSEETAALLQEALTVTADRFALPAYARHAEATSSLTAALEIYCEGQGDLAAVNAAFAETFLAWQRASLMQVGPIMDAEGPMRVQLWPDPKGFARRATMSAIRAEDRTLLAPGVLEGHSVALVSLTALEDLVTERAPANSYACDLATAIARFQADLAAKMRDAWVPGSAFRTDYDGAVDGNERYPSVEAVVREVLAGAVVYTDRLRKFKIQRGLGSAPGDARPARTEAAQSGLGLRSIIESFRALSALYTTPGGLFDVASGLSGSKEAYILSQTATNLANALTLEVGSLAEIAEEDGPRAAELRRYGQLVSYHEAFLKSAFVRSIGLTSGFTSADGD